MEESYKGYQIEIDADTEPKSPREWETFGTMVCFHNGYSLGDKTEYRREDFSGWEELEKQIEKDHKPVIILPLFLYDHSGITISAKPFGCRWDSGQVGFIFVSGEKVKQNWNVKRLSKKLKEKAEKLLLSEVKTYDDYLRGNVYNFSVDDKEGNFVDSCCGFFGNPEESGLLEEAKNAVDWDIKKKCEVRQKKLKSFIQQKVGLSHRQLIAV